MRAIIQSLKLSSFDTSCTTSYQSAAVTIGLALSCIIIEIFDVEEYYDLKIYVMGHSPCEFMHDLYITEI